MLNHHRPLDTRLPGMLRSGKRLRGLINPLAAPALIEMIGYCGFDFAVIDNEHGPASFETTEHLLRAARAAGVPAIVRCLEQDIARTLDLGPSGILVPMVNTPEHAQRIVRAAKYPHTQGPGAVEGALRGCAFSTRAAGFGAFGGPQHLQGSNDGVAVIVQCETAQAVENATAIAAVSGVDMVFVGSNDLSHNLGHENRLETPQVQQTIETALRAIRAGGKPCGLPAMSPAEEDRYSAWGATFFFGGTTGLIMKAFKEVAAWPRPE